jgi:hypothetical protein
MTRSISEAREEKGDREGRIGRQVGVTRNKMCHESVDARTRRFRLRSKGSLGTYLQDDVLRFSQSFPPLSFPAPSFPSLLSFTNRHRG